MIDNGTAVTFLYLNLTDFTRKMQFNTKEYICFSYLKRKKYIKQILISAIKYLHHLNNVTMYRKLLRNPKHD